ncbi:hypothetical protein ACS0TY_004686 [Phlomoides rotata]
MEASLQSPSIESFSYSWLSNLKPDSLISAVDQDDQHNSFIEMDPRLPPSKRFIRVSSEFGFDFPISESPFGLIHADEVISNGFLVPLFVKDEKIEGHDGNCMPTASDASSLLTTRTMTWRVRCAPLRRCQRLSKRFFRKYLKILLRPFFCSNVRINGINRSWELSAATSPRTSVAYSLDDNWRRSCDSESSIYEAVLHCKRTQGK